MDEALIDTDVVAGEVRAWLGRRARSVRSAALELGWSEVYLGRRLNGQVAFNVNDLAMLARLLGVPVTVFFSPPNVANLGMGSGNLRFSAPLQVAA